MGGRKNGIDQGVKLSTWRATALHSVDITLIKHIMIQLTNHLGLFEKLHGVCVGAGLENKLFRAVALQ